MDNQKSMNKRTIVIVVFLVLVAVTINWLMRSQNGQEAASILSEPTRVSTTTTATTETTSKDVPVINFDEFIKTFSPTKEDPTLIKIDSNAGVKSSTGESTEINTISAITFNPSYALGTGDSKLYILLKGSYSGNDNHYPVTLFMKLKWPSSSTFSNLFSWGPGTQQSFNAQAYFTANPGNFGYKVCAQYSANMSSYQVCGAEKYFTIAGTASCSYLAGYPVPPCLNQVSNTLPASYATNLQYDYPVQIN